MAVPEKLEVRVPGDLVKVEGDGYNLNRNEVDNGSKEFEKHTVDNCLLILRPLQGVELPTGSFSSCRWGSLLLGELSSLELRAARLSERQFALVLSMYPG